MKHLLSSLWYSAIILICLGLAVAIREQELHAAYAMTLGFLFLGLVRNLLAGNEDYEDIF